MRARRVAALATAGLGAAALIAACAPISGRVCQSPPVTVSSTTSGALAAAPPGSGVCHGTSLVYAFGPPWLAVIWLGVLTLLTLVPLLVPTRRWPSGAAAAVLAGLYALTFGATLYWVPAALAAAVSAALPPSGAPAQPRALSGG